MNRNVGETNDLQRMRGLIDKLNEASRRYYDQNEQYFSIRKRNCRFKDR